MREAGNDAVAIEASSHGSHYRRLDRVRFDALVFTNLTQEHLDLHGDMEEYFQAKRRLFTGITASPAAINIGDPYGRRLADELEAAHRAPFVTFGLRPEADVRADGLELGPHGSTFTAAGLDLETHLPGIFNVENVLGAVAAAMLLDVDDGRDHRGNRARSEASPGGSRQSTRGRGSPWSSTTPTSRTRSRPCSRRPVRSATGS